MSAVLNCAEKLITINFRGEEKTIDLKEGDLDSSWNHFFTKDGLCWTTEFHWDEEDEDDEGGMSIYENKNREIGDEVEYIDEIVLNGTKEEYFKI
tara:strand:- start:10070 stop:10354 length:285 start_codon:yes stop_codon:yes gene_type:complete